jgi:hypothetical protein
LRLQQVWRLVLPLALAVRQLVWLEPRPIGLMPVAVRTAAPTGWWSKKIGYLKIFACGFRQAFDNQTFVSLTLP